MKRLEDYKWMCPQPFANVSTDPYGIWQPCCTAQFDERLSSDEDWEKLVEIAENTIDFWADNALEHERCGEMIERIGLVNFLDGIGIDVDPNMVANPRESSYVRTDDWDQEAVKWYEKADKKETA